MIDFGSCQKYLNQEGHHLKFELEKEHIKSSPKFRTIYVHTHKSKEFDMQELVVEMIWRVLDICWSTF